MPALRARRVLSARRKPGGYLLVLECRHIKTVTMYRQNSTALCAMCPPLERKKRGRKK